MSNIAAHDTTLQAAVLVRILRSMPTIHTQKLGLTYLQTLPAAVPKTEDTSASQGTSSRSEPQSQAAGTLYGTCWKQKQESAA